MKTFSPFITNYKVWLDSARDTVLKAGVRTYCLLGAEQLDWRYFRDTLFNRDDANKTYVANYKSLDLKAKKPGTTLQRDINATFSLHRSFVTRHKTRLQVYRDDLSNKGKRLPFSVSAIEQQADKLNKDITGLA